MPSVQQDSTPREKRVQCTPTKVSVLVSGLADPVSAEVRDVSRSGANLILERPVSPGSQVSFDMGELFVKGSIRYCQPDGPEHFRSGIVIDDVRPRAV